MYRIKDDKMKPNIKTPWLTSYKDLPFYLDYPDISMFEMMERAAKSTPNLYAYDFLGVKCTFKNFVKRVRQCAKALTSIGIRQGDRVTVCLPNCPQALFMFYGLNLIGALGNMIHPLSSEGR